MPARHKTLAILLLTLLALAAPAFALDKSRALTQYVHRIWQTQQGLPEATIYCVTQTRDGYLYLGTLTGLVRFDGARFTRINQFGDLTLGPVPILALAEDPSGTLWLATDGKGVIGLKDGAAIHLTTDNGLPSNRATALLVDSKNNLWIATAAGLGRFSDGRLTSFTTKDGLVTDNLRALCENTAHQIIAAGDSNRLSIFADGKGFPDGKAFHGKTLASLLQPATIQALASTPDNILYIASSEGLIRLNADNSERRLTTADGLADDYVYCLHSNPDGALWAGTRDGFSRIAGSDIQSFHGKDGLSQSTVHGLFEDKERSLWVVTKHGLDQFLDGRTVPVTTREGLASNDTGPILQDGSGAIWVGTLDAGLSEYDGHNFHTLTTADGLPSDRILSLAQTPGTLWIGTDKGLATLQQNKITATFSVPNGLPSATIRALLVDPTGRLFVGTAAGLAYYDGKVFLPTAIHSPIIALAEYHDGSIAVATESRVEFFSLTPRTPALKPIQLDHAADTLYEDPDHLLWIGTLGGGLRCFDGAGTSSFSMRDGLFDDDIFSVISDQHDRLWMACSKGVFFTSRSELRAFAAGGGGQIHHITSTPFSPTDALRTIECKAGIEPAAALMNDGRLWFATTRGVVILDPARLPRRLAPPPVVIEEVAVDGRSENPVAIQTLPAGRKNLMFRYTGLSFVVPGRLTFRYQLQGFDKSWIDAGARREAFYTNLPPGSYNFRVQACNVDGVWTDPDVATAAVSFALAPAWYQHAWFIPLCILTAAVLSAIGFHLRVRTLRHRMQLVLAERSRIARELHDTLLQGFAGVTMEMQALSVRLPASSERRTLEEIISDAAVCLKEARRSVAGLRDRAAKSTGFAVLLEATARELTAGAGIEIVMEKAPPSTIRLPANVEFTLMRISREAITNTVRHAGATRIEIALELQDDHLLLEIFDDGKGFAATPHGASASPGARHGNAAVVGHYGLLGMHERAAEIAATLDIASAPGEGTHITIRLPLKIAAEPVTASIGGSAR